MKIAIGADHGGFSLKEEVRKHLDGRFEIIDLGCYSSESVDYPIYAEKVARAVAEKNADLGILVCTSGVGMSIAANKIKGIRAALVTNDFCAEKSREHNNANVLCLGSANQNLEDALRFVDLFLNSQFLGDRHSRRVDEINKLDEEK